MIDAHGVERLTDSPGRDLDPNWSPDGQHVVFDSDRNYIAEQIRQVFIMNADGSSQTPITQPPHEDGHASWSHGPLPAVPPSISRAEGRAGSATVRVTAPLVAHLGLARPFSAWSVTALGRHRTLERITGLE